MKKRITFLICAVVFFSLGFLIELNLQTMPFAVANYGSAVLWAAAVYAFVGFILAKNAAVHGVIAAVLCVGLELLQLYTPSFLTAARSVPIVGYLLGTDFSLGDIVVYIITVAVCFIAEFLISAKKPKVRPSKYRK